jgi:hypothetical protein
MRPVFAIIIVTMLSCYFSGVSVTAQATDEIAADSLESDSITVDSAIVIPVDSTGTEAGSLALTDSVGVKEQIPMVPPVRLIDSLVYYFARHQYQFEIQQEDLYPREAAGFLYHEASYFTMTYVETPLRTTSSPFGLPGDRITVRSGTNEVAPYDRTVPSDGLVDFNDIATGDVSRATIVEGPLTGYGSTGGGSSLLYLEPIDIPEGQAESKLMVERGAFGYAYTRGRIARMISPKFGFSFSTDYRKGDGFDYNNDDDSYNVKVRIVGRLRPRTILDAGINVYRRKGGISYYRRYRRDEQWVVSLTRQQFYGGQLTGRYTLDLSRSEDVTKTVKPRNTYADVSYLWLRPGRLYQATLRFGKEQYYINTLFESRFYGYGDLSAFFNFKGGQLFVFGRFRHAESQDMAIESAIGYSRLLGNRWKVIVSGGYLNSWPGLTDLYLMDRYWESGEFERGNIDLKATKTLSGNATLAYAAEKFELSASFNAGQSDDIIYYDRRYASSGTALIRPENDRITFADLNLAGSFRELWWFYGKASVTGRRLDSDRYGNRPPYSPRWQVYSQLGLEYYIAKLKVLVRAFGDMTYTEVPLSYSLQELQTAAIFDWGINAALKDFTFYYMMHNFTNQLHLQPEGYGYTGWFYSWGFNWKFWD